MNKKRISVVMATAMAASMAAVPMTASADDTDEKEEIITEQGIEVQVYEVEIDKQNFYKASFSYDDNYYYCKGQMDYSEMQKILKYLIVLEN